MAIDFTRSIFSEKHHQDGGFAQAGKVVGGHLSLSSRTQDSTRRLAATGSAFTFSASIFFSCVARCPSPSGFPSAESGTPVAEKICGEVFPIFPGNSRNAVRICFLTGSSIRK